MIQLRELISIRKGKKPPSTHSARGQDSSPLLLTPNLRGLPSHQYCEPFRGQVIADPGDILISWDGSVGVTGFNLQGTVGSTLGLIKVKNPNEFSPEYIWHFLRYKESYLRQNSRGSSIPHLDPRLLDELTLPEPDVFSQIEIATILTRIQTLIAATKTMSELIERLKKSLLADLLASEKTSHKELQSLTADISSGSTPSRQNPDFWNGDIPWVKSGELHQPSISATEECVTQLALSKSSIKLIPEGAVLLAMYGATAGAVSQLAIPATTNQAICSLIPNEDLDAGYLKAVLQSKLSELLGLRSGGAQQNLSVTTIKSFKIPVPEKSIQIVFASKLHALEKIAEKADSLQQRFSDLSTSLMVEAFETKAHE